VKTLHAIFPAMSLTRPELNDDERAIYEWQMWIPGFGTAGQRKLKSASLLISRVGGLGGVVAYQLAATGIGRLVFAMFAMEAHITTILPGRTPCRTASRPSRPRIGNGSSPCSVPSRARCNSGA